MSNYTGPKNRLARREAFDIFGRGNKLRRATVPPGQHGPKGSRRPTDYGIRLREKQKTKRIYGIMEAQFRKYFEKATKVSGKTGEILLTLLENRLDNIVYRLGFASTRPMARQLVSHGHILVDGKKVSLPSYQVRPNQTVAITPKGAAIPAISALLQSTEIHPPAWLDRQGPVGKVVSQPAKSGIDYPIDDQLIVEFYSR